MAHMMRQTAVPSFSAGGSDPMWRPLSPCRPSLSAAEYQDLRIAHPHHYLDYLHRWPSAQTLAPRSSAPSSNAPESVPVPEHPVPWSPTGTLLWTTPVNGLPHIFNPQATDAVSNCHGDVEARRNYPPVAVTLGWLFCEREFAEMADRAAHELTHVGVDAFRCPEPRCMRQYDIRTVLRAEHCHHPVITRTWRSVGHGKFTLEPPLAARATSMSPSEAPSTAGRSSLRQIDIPEYRPAAQIPQANGHPGTSDPMLVEYQPTPQRSSGLAAEIELSQRLDPRGPWRCFFCAHQLRTSADRTVHEHEHIAIPSLACPELRCRRRYDVRTVLDAQMCTHPVVARAWCPIGNGKFVLDPPLVPAALLWPASVAAPTTARGEFEPRPVHATRHPWPSTDEHTSAQQGGARRHDFPSIRHYRPSPYPYPPAPTQHTSRTRLVSQPPQMRVRAADSGGGPSGAACAPASVRPSFSSSGMEPVHAARVSPYVFDPELSGVAGPSFSWAEKGTSTTAGNDGITGHDRGYHTPVHPSSMHEVIVVSDDSSSEPDPPGGAEGTRMDDGTVEANVIETREPLYTCLFCPHQSCSSTDWRRHESAHTGAYIYQCPEPGCGRGYNSREILVAPACLHPPTKRVWQPVGGGKFVLDPPLERLAVPGSAPKSMATSTKAHGAGSVQPAGINPRSHARFDTDATARANSPLDATQNPSESCERAKSQDQTDKPSSFSAACPGSLRPRHSISTPAHAVGLGEEPRGRV